MKIEWTSTHRLINTLYKLGISNVVPMRFFTQEVKYISRKEYEQLHELMRKIHD